MADGEKKSGEGFGWLALGITSVGSLGVGFGLGYLVRDMQAEEEAKAAQAPPKK
jgi:hypothetical protein